MLPGSLMVSEPGSFAEHTIVQRKPQILANILATNSYPPEIVAALAALRREIATDRVAPLTEETPDAPAWNATWRARQGLRWTELDWFWAETYFYRRVLEAVCYFQPGPWLGADPFEALKRGALAEGLAPIAQAYGALPPDAPWRQAVWQWLARSLWGNRVDLSNITLAAFARDDPAHVHDDLLLIDHRTELVALLAQGLGRVEWVCDNCGEELLCDLALLDVLLTEGLVAAVCLRVKRDPYFVSDAMSKDVAATVAALASAAEGALRALGARLLAHQGAGRLRVAAHPFWNSWQHFSQFPTDLRAELAAADLLVFKGDANYRRLVEDRHWPHTARLEEIATDLPAPAVALRTLKSEVLVGLPAGRAEALAREDPAWLINGKRGVIHLMRPAHLGR